MKFRSDLISGHTEEEEEKKLIGYLPGTNACENLCRTCRPHTTDYLASDLLRRFCMG